MFKKIQEIQHKLLVLEQLMHNYKLNKEEISEKINEIYIDLENLEEV